MFPWKEEDIGSWPSGEPYGIDCAEGAERGGGVLLAGGRRAKNKVVWVELNIFACVPGGGCPRAGGVCEGEQGRGGGAFCFGGVADLEWNGVLGQQAVVLPGQRV